MLARIQILVTLGVLASAGVWMVSLWHHSAVLACAGTFMITFGYTVVLALEFVFHRHVSRRDGLNTASWSDLTRAWWREALIAPTVFCWRQPFRPNELEDQLTGPSVKGQRGVVLVHGYVCNRGFWTPWLRQLRISGRAYVAVNLEPLFGSLDDYASTLDQAVNRVAAASGMPPVMLCHSMGGLAARAWLVSRQGQSRIHRIVTIATPHRGTWLARFGQAHNVRQMRQDSPWLLQLQLRTTASMRALFVCWYSNCDNVVFPPSVGQLEGADNRLVLGAAHVQLAFTPEVMQSTLALLESPESVRR